MLYSLRYSLVGASRAFVPPCRIGPVGNRVAFVARSLRLRLRSVAPGGVARAVRGLRAAERSV